MASCPFVYWAQDANEVFLTVDLRDSSNVEASVKGRTFRFKCIGSGAQGRKNYSFSLSLFDRVQLSKVPKEGGSSLQYTLKKETIHWWPNITKEQERISWLRVDFDRFVDPDDSDSSEGLSKFVNPTNMDYDEKLDELTKKILHGHEAGLMSRGPVAKILTELSNNMTGLLNWYLVGYNFFMFLIHFYVLSYLLSYYIIDGFEFVQRFWVEKSYIIILATQLQLFDVIHSLAGLTKTGFAASLTQVLGRLTVLYVINGFSFLHTATSTFSLMIVYFLIEMFRYPYYAVSSLKKEFKLTTWLRYNMWIPLYPAGFILEAITLVRAIPYYYENDKYSISMPNAANITFNFGVYLCILLVALPIIGSYLMYYMLLQRRKKFVTISKKLA